MTDTQLAPTDDEIDALWRFEASKNWDSTLAMRTSFARAVLARWGQPAHSGELLAWVDERAVAWLQNNRSQSATITTILGKAKSFERPMPMYGYPQPVERESLSADEQDKLYWRLHSLSKSLEGRGRIDEQDNPDAYHTILDAMNALRDKKGGQHGADT